MFGGSYENALGILDRVEFRDGLGGGGVQRRVWDFERETDGLVDLLGGVVG